LIKVYFIFLVLVATAPWRTDAASPQQGRPGTPQFSCDPGFAALFVPARPRLGRYEVCATDRPIDEVAEPSWAREELAPLDAFGAAGSYDAHAVSRLYGGSRAVVARGWIQSGDTFEAVTLISPHPDAMLSRLLPGTLRIRLIICCQ
jgi:hypothetical protein